MKQQKTFTLQGEYIELIKLLKLMSVAQSGSHAKYLVDEGMIIRNGEQELRKRAKLRAGDKVEVMDIIIDIEK